MYVRENIYLRMCISCQLSYGKNFETALLIFYLWCHIKVYQVTNWHKRRLLFLSTFLGSNYFWIIPNQQDYIYLCDSLVTINEIKSEMKNEKICTQVGSIYLYVKVHIVFTALFLITRMTISVFLYLLLFLLLPWKSFLFTWMAKGTTNLCVHLLPALCSIVQV